ncbi:hypothetical protein EAF00_011644 [Botryotinia globosa]|nr:hypothetical protein EAF00_011644 [Botryotinia globosa]
MSSTLLRRAILRASKPFGGPRAAKRTCNRANGDDVQGISKIRAFTIAPPKVPGMEAGVAVNVESG